MFKQLTLALLLALQGTTQTGTPGGVISGRVLLADGMPAAGVAVSIVASTSGVMGKTVQTTSDGHYRLEDVSPGRYYIASGNTFYPGAVSMSAARSVEVRPGVPVESIDFSMAAPPPFRPELKSCSGALPEALREMGIAAVAEKLVGVWRWQSVQSYWGGGVRNPDRNLSVTFKKDHTYEIRSMGSGRGHSQEPTLVEQGTWQVSPNSAAKLVLSGASKGMFEGIIGFCEKEVGFDSRFRDGEVFTWTRE